jgi:aryl-alcohol dehydrogenase-like predicted oxidoreductase
MPTKKNDPERFLPNPKLYNLPFTVGEFRGMPYRMFGDTGLRVSNVGLGTWKIGCPETGDGSRVNEKMAFKIFDAAVEEGVTFWDTANRYNNSSGNSERIIGKWFAANPAERRTIELATKIYGTMDGLTPNYCRLSRLNVLEAVYASLERLRTDRIELLQFHWFDETTPIEESLMAVEDLISQDIVRYFGVSNFNIAHLEKYLALKDSLPRARVRSVQNQFDILCGEDPTRRGLLEYCAKNGLSFIAWSPLRGGLLSDRYLDKSKIKRGDRLMDEKRVDQELTEPVLDKLTKLVVLARKEGLTVTQLVLAYMLQIPGMGPMIAACSSPKQVKENAHAGKIVLSKEQISALENITGKIIEQEVGHEIQK